jgi:glycosyltransferase involved in cell wall biosynthesis
VPTIVYLGGFELPDRNAAAQRVRNNARILRALGCRVVLLGTSRARPFDRRIHPADAGDSELEAWEVGYPQTRRQWFDTIRADWPLRELAASGAIDPAGVAAVICYNHPAVAQWRIARLARSWGAAALADCTEWYARRPWTSLANIVKNLDVPLRMRWVNRRMDGLITTSPYISEFYRRTGLPIVEVPTLMETLEGDVPVAEAVATPMPLFAVASGFAEGTDAKGVHDRIDWALDLLDGAAARGHTFTLRIVGVDRERYLSVFPGQEALLERLGDRVIFMGRRPRAEVLRHLQASAFAFVLRHESRVTLAGFPSKYSEAITYGTPAIINALPSVRAYHVEGRTGISLDPEDRGGAVEAMCDALAMDPQAIMAMKRYCRKYGAFTAEAFKAPVSDFLSAVTGMGNACRSIA